MLLPIEAHRFAPPMETYQCEQSGPRARRGLGTENTAGPPGAERHVGSLSIFLGNSARFTRQGSMPISASATASSNIVWSAPNKIADVLQAYVDEGESA
jgi:hypothetical protein